MFRRTKKFLKDNEGPIAFGAGIFVGSALVIAYPKFFMDSTAFYDPKQPIPDLLLTEESIKWELISGFIASDFLNKKELMEEFSEFAGSAIKKSLDLREKTL